MRFRSVVRAGVVSGLLLSLLIGGQCDVLGQQKNNGGGEAG